MDKIYIRDLKVRCLVGINKSEKIKKQDVTINITLYSDLSIPGGSDSIEDAVNYKTLKDKVIDLVEGSQFALIERLAEVIAELSLEHPLVEKVDVTVDKPGALRFARSVAVEISRTRNWG